MEKFVMCLKGVVGIFCSMCMVVCSGVDSDIDTGVVLINEFMVRNSANSPYMDCLGQHEDWVELYNPGAEAVLMSNFYITDREDNLQKKQLYDTLIPSGGYYLLWGGDTANATGDTICEHHNHLGFGFDATDTAKNEKIIISNVNGDILDSVSFVGISEATKQDTSYGRFPNGSGTWKAQLSPSPGTANVGLKPGLSSKRK